MPKLNGGLILAPLKLRRVITFIEITDVITYP